MGEELAAIVRAEVRAKGPIPFSRWMELCLYHPVHGYYMKPGRKTGAGRDADFVTPPTVHPFFGKAIGREVAQAWERAGRPATFDVVEWGGGEGGLAQEALGELDRGDPDLARAITWTHVERSPEHRARQRSAADPRMRWTEAPAPGARATHDVAVLCEVLDAIPFDVLAWDGKAWAECKVGLDATGMRFIEHLDASAAAQERGPALVEHDRRKAGGLVPLALAPGQRVADQSQARRLLEAACDATRHLVLVADYMEWPRTLYDGSRLHVARGYRRHEHADVLASPGDVDITATVDIVQATATRGKVWPHGSDAIASMEEFVLRHGILDELNGTDRSTLEGASSYLRLRQLLLPTGMGAAFKVMRLERESARDEATPPRA